MISIRTNYKHTVFACYGGYITQAIVNIFTPLLFVTFHRDFGIPLNKIGLLVTVNFGVQLLVDLISAKYAAKIGYRRLIVAAHLLSAAGLVCLGIFPDIFPDPYIGICCAVMLYAVGGGLIEVLISPILEACPSDNKHAAMSLLHSFYCWGSVLVVLVSTVLFRWLGIGSWRVVACLWAVIPLLNGVSFMMVPIDTLEDRGASMSIPELLKTPFFWILAMLMVCAGASELSVSQWVSAFAEKGLHITKEVGDLLGPCMFAVLMGLSRILHAKLAGRMDLRKYLTACAAVCVVSYLLVSLSNHPFLSLLGSGLCGISVGAMWPGIFSLAGERIPKGGTAMFALLALAGDTGCSAGPTLVGYVSSAFGDDLNKGLLSAVAFPCLMLTCLILCRRKA